MVRAPLCPSESTVGDASESEAGQRAAICDFCAERELTSNSAGSVHERDPRVTEEPVVPALEALAALKEGNRRFSERLGELIRQASVARPSAVILGCADLRITSETIFDTGPGDLFILRNAGNTPVKPTGSAVGSMEYAVEHVGVKLILVLGHMGCGAMLGAAKVMRDRKANGTATSKSSALDALLGALVPVVEATAAQLPEGADSKAIANSAVRTNVFHSMSMILRFSSLIAERVRSGDVEVHGGIYDPRSGRVEFLGQHPLQQQLLGSTRTNL